MLKKILQKIKKNKINLLLMLIFLLTITYAMINYLPYWDEAVYTNNGKFLFSAQEISTYEYQRPPIMGILIGLFWFIGINEVIFTKIILSIIFILGLFYLYRIAEDIKKGTGIITTLLFASILPIIAFSNRLLTEIPGTSLSIIAYYLFTKRKYFQSGFIFSLAFLFRYPAGLVFGVVGVFLVIELLKERNLKKIKNILSYGLGFCLLVVPFIIINYLFLPNITSNFFSKIIAPFTHASQMVAANAQDLVTNGFIYYLKFLLLQNFLLLFTILFIVMVVLFKKIRKDFLKKNLLIPFTIAISYLIYLSSLVHYEPRYFFSALPFFAIISGVGATEFIEKINFKKAIMILEIIFLIVLIFNYSISINLQISNNKQTDLEAIDNYYQYILKTDPDFEGLVAIDNPVFGIYNEKSKIVYLAGPFYAQAVVLENQPIKYILYEERNFVCWREGDKECVKKLDLFLSLLKEEYTLVYTEDFYGTKHYIYKLNYLWNWWKRH